MERASLPWDSLPTALENFDLLVDGRLVNAAPLFFSKKPPLKLRCAVFGTETTSFIIDRQDFEGDLLELIEVAQKYILKNIHIGMRLEGLYRVDVPEIAVPALREAIINAFCHRDYRDLEYVQVAVFKNRVEIRNPGTLFGGLTIESLRKGKLSRRRNPLIAQMLTRIHMVETWGRGMTLIFENEPGVQFEEFAGIFIASFARSSLADNANGQGKDEAAIIKTGTMTSTKTSMKTGTKTTQALLNFLSKQEKDILQIIEEAPAISLQDIAAKIGLSKNGARHHTDKLRRKGILRRIGGAKGGHWEIVQNE